MKPCPGKTFSQAKYVAAMAYMFRRHRVPVVKEMPTKSEEAAHRGHGYSDWQRNGASHADAEP
jgi:hypothetical protein